MTVSSTKTGLIRDNMLVGNTAYIPPVPVTYLVIAGGGGGGGDNQGTGNVSWA